MGGLGRAWRPKEEGRRGWQKRLPRHKKLLLDSGSSSGTGFPRTFMSVLDLARASAFLLRSLMVFSFSALALSASNRDTYLLSALSTTAAGPAVARRMASFFFFCYELSGIVGDV